MEHKKRCKKCGQETTNEFELVTIKTMTVHGFRKNKIYQAMGDILTESVCDECIDHYIEKETHPTRQILYRISITALQVIFGLVLFILVELWAVKFFGIIITIVAICGCIQEIKNIQKKVIDIQNRSNVANRKVLGIELLSKLLPKKHVDAELTYIELKRVMKEDLSHLGKEYGVSLKKLESIRQYIKTNGKEKVKPKNA